MWSYLSIFLISLLAHHAVHVQGDATCTSSQIDMVLCLDGSYSMGSSYPDVQKFAVDVVDKFSPTPTTTRIAVLRYESDVTIGTKDSDGSNDDGFSGDESAIKAAINVKLPGGITYTDKCIKEAETLFDTKARAGAAKLILVLTDGSPTDQAAAVKASEDAMKKGIVIVGVGAQVGASGRDTILALTSNQCDPSQQGSCTSGLTGPPSCVTPCNDHYIDASTFAALDGIVDNVVELTCVDPGCQYTWGGWSACTPKDASFTCSAVGGVAVTDCETRSQSPVISFDPTPGSRGATPACPLDQTAECGSNECNAPADFLLLLDASGSMSSTDWRSQISFAKDFVSLLPNGDVTAGKFDYAQVAILQFSSASATVDQSLTDSRTASLNLLNPASYSQKSGGKFLFISLISDSPTSFFSFLTLFVVLFLSPSSSPLCTPAAPPHTTHRHRHYGCHPSVHC